MLHTKIYLISTGFPWSSTASLIPSFIQLCPFTNFAGMDYMTEFQRQGSDEEPRYTCELCESKMDQRQVINHLIGIKHRMKYYVSSQATLGSLL